MDDKINDTVNLIQKENIDISSSETGVQSGGDSAHVGHSINEHHSGRRVGHHHHSSHHRHHSSHRSKKNKMPKVNSRLILILSISVLLMLVVCAVMLESINHHNPGNEGDETISSENLVVEVHNREGVLVSDAVTKYLLTDIMSSYNFEIRPSDFVSNNDGRLDAQVPVVLEMEAKNAGAMTYKVELADNAAFADAQIFYVDGTDGECVFKHLYASAEYFYRVTVYTGRGANSVTGSFKTADTPRILSIEGIYNVRDIGNWRTDSGKRIKQGLLIRGTEMDGAVESVYHLTNEGLDDMLGELGIKTDMDLRAQTPMTKDALGSRVDHKYYSMVMYGDVFTEEGKERVRAVFADLANPDNYPIYLHCTYGCDRTGTICYLLEAMLGVSRGDCRKEYGLSNLHIANILVVENGLKEYGGDTLKEQAEAYLISCGVTTYQIESIRNIFLGD